MPRRIKLLLAIYALEIADRLIAAGEIGVFLLVFWKRHLIRLPYYLFWGVVLAGYFAWTSLRCQVWQAQLGLGIIIAGIAAMPLVAILAGHSSSPAYLSPLGVIFVGLVVMAVSPEDKPALNPE